MLFTGLKLWCKHYVYAVEVLSIPIQYARALLFFLWYVFGPSPTHQIRNAYSLSLIECLCLVWWYNGFLCRTIARNCLFQFILISDHVYITSWNYLRDVSCRSVYIFATILDSLWLSIAAFISSGDLRLTKNSFVCCRWVCMGISLNFFSSLDVIFKICGDCIPTQFITQATGTSIFFT